MIANRWYLVVYGVLALALVCGLGAVAVMVALTPGSFEDSLGRAASILFVSLLGALLVRYLVLLWLGYLQHIEGVAEHQRLRDSTHYWPAVSIIVPAFNEEMLIDAAIRSLLRQDYPRFEIIVVDDGSTDATYARAVELEGPYGGATVRVISKSNGGKAAALNTGIALARHSLVVCVDGDSVLSPDTLRNMVPHFLDERVGAVAGNVKVVNRNNLWSRVQALEYIEGLNMTRRAQGFLRAVNVIPGPIGMFRRDALVAVGGYDTDTYAEDADLTLKLLTAGYRIKYEDRAIAYTEAPETLQQLIKQRYRWTRGGLQALAKRRHMLAKPKEDTVVWLSMTMMLFDYLVWPFLHVFGTLFFLLIAVVFGASSFIIGWWAMFLLLDVAMAMYTVAMEREDLMLVPIALVWRIFFMLLLDVVKAFASIEEALDVQMSWGKLERLGRI
jgi:poly-beta-1,6-N-acetyl-D-glucosamine synthase